MMKIVSPVQQALFATIHIEVRYADGNQGIGTGFIYRYALEDDLSFLALVTNKHVIDNAISGTLSFVSKQNDESQLGTRIDIGIDEFEQLWHGHPDSEVDVTIASLTRILDEHKKQGGIEVYYRSIGSESILSPERIEDMDALEDVVFIGFPNNIWDEVNVLPVIRQGITATPVTVDFMGKKQFLIDASVFPGSSGSPVFVRRHGIIGHGYHFWFLGILSGAFFHRKTGKIQMAPIPTDSGDKDEPMPTEMIDLGLVWKASTVEENIVHVLRKEGFIE